MRRVRFRLEQYKDEIEKKSQYKHGLPGSALDIVNTLLNDLEQDEKENGWIPVKYHQISEKEREEEIRRFHAALHLRGKRVYRDGKAVWYG